MMAVFRRRPRDQAAHPASKKTNETMTPLFESMHPKQLTKLTNQARNRKPMTLAMMRETEMLNQVGSKTTGVMVRENWATVK